MLKTCIKCGEEKEEELFSWASKKDKRRVRQCKSCIAKLTASHFQRHKKEYSESLKRTRQRALEALREYKEKHPCKDCGNFFPYFIKDFDHVDRTQKVDNVSNFIRNGSGQGMWEEVAKCELVCANCHRTRTWSRKDYRAAKLI